MARPTERAQKPDTATADQSEVIAFLADPASYHPPVAEVDRIETHGALVFLAGDFAYKLKRAIKLPYMDFSTLEKRAAACRHEIGRNRAAAPEIYIHAAAIRRLGDGRLALDTGDRTAATEAGDIVDWVVVMRRFAQDDLLDNLARRQALDLRHMAPLAEHIAACHEAAPRHLDVDGDENLARVITQTITAFHYAADDLGMRRVRDYSGSIVNALNAHSRLLRQRARKGYVRLCHGDLHLRNIVLFDGRPTLFDAIEFDDSIATIDVLYDLAFLLMDLWHRDLRTHANLCFNQYVSAAMSAAALDGLAALPLFAATRAAVRAVVALDRRAVAEPDERAAITAEIEAYFALAQKFLAPSEPRLITVGGYSGTGKTTLAAGLAPLVGRMPGAVHLRSDVERKRMFGVDPLATLPRQGYTEMATEKVYRRLCLRAEKALRAGQSVVVDAVFLTPHHRRWIESVAAKTNVPFHGIWLDAPGEQLVKRVTERRNDASDADAAVVMQQLATHTISLCWQTIDARRERQMVLARAAGVLGLKAAG